MAVSNRSLLVRSVLKEELLRVLEEYRTSGSDPTADPEAVLGLVGTRAKAFRAEARAAHPDLPASYLSFHGAETIDADFGPDGGMVDAGEAERHSLSYLNTGETYRDTLCYDHSERTFFVGSWGDWTEGRDPRNLKDDEDIAAATRAFAGAGVPAV